VRPAAAVAALLALAAVLVCAPVASAQPTSPPLTATILFEAGTPANGIFPTGTPIPIILQIENTSGGTVATTQGFSVTDFFRRLYFIDPLGGTITNKIEEQIHGDSRVFMCLSRNHGVLLPLAIPVAPIELLPGPANPPNFFREYQIDDARTLYDLSRPGSYTVNARISLLVFTLSDPNAVVNDCDQVPGQNANVAALTGSTSFTIESNTLAFQISGPPLQPPVTTATISPTPNPSGAVFRSATVTFSASSPSGVPIQRIVVQSSGAQAGQESLPGAQGSITISALGQTNIAYHAEDSAGDIETPKLTSVTIVTDITPPTTIASETPAPNVNGWDSTNATVTLAATDNPGGSGVKQITYSASGAQTIASTTVTGSSATVSFTTEGVTTLTYFAQDNAGNSEAHNTLTVQIDRTKPVIAGMPIANCSLWPPDHKLVQIANVTATDALSGLASAPTVTVTSNEPTDAGDIVITGGVVQVAATRAGSGTGRVYTVTATVTDKAGNKQTATGTCTVPHDQGN
jgi:hypothetical protein